MLKVVFVLENVFEGMSLQGPSFANCNIGKYAGCTAMVFYRMASIGYFVVLEHISNIRQTTEATAQWWA